MKDKTKTKQRVPFNMFDGCILLFLLTVLLAVLYGVFLIDQLPFGKVAEGSGKETVVYTLEISGVDRDLLDDASHLPVVKGDAVYNVTASFAIGKVLSISDAMPYIVPTTSVDENGRLLYAQHPEKSTFLIEVEALASFVDGAYVIDGKIVRIGDTFTMVTPYFTASAYCKDIREVNGNE